MNKVRIENDGQLEAVVNRIRARGDAGQAYGVQAEKITAVEAIVAAVQERGDSAVVEFTSEFDKVDLRPDQFELTQGEVDDAVKGVEPALIGALERSHKNIRSFHSKHLRQSWEETLDNGSVIGQRISPIECAGVYVPGGTAFYPSSVLMNIVPARVAGVREIIMVSPPSFEGSIHPVALAAARIAGVTRVFRVGGAQAIAALAYGTETIPRVLKITGPGNTYVTEAKRQIRSICDIDTEAGPSEVAVIADDTADPRLVAGELLAQAEHDIEATSVLVTPSDALAEAVEKAVEKEIQTLSRSDIIRKSLSDNGVLYIVRSLDEATLLCNEFAAEHLAIYTEYPRKALDGIRNAGAVMLGQATTVVLGDYIAGPNHILPTGRRARFASPLSAEDFRKVSSIISYTSDGIQAVRDDTIHLSNVEGLTAHTRAIEMRK